MAALLGFFHGDPTLPHLLLALLLGALIGVERQLRQRTAGLRTNALVCLGAAAFVDLGATLGGNAGATQVIAYVVSGVGFLGAGAIMKEGVNIRGLNTAATLWCSAAVGASAGVGETVAAVGLCALLIVTNLFLRPLIALIDRRTYGVVAGEELYTLRVFCDAAAEAHIRALILHGFLQAGVAMRSLDSANVDGTTQVEVHAWCSAPAGRAAGIEQIAGRLSLEPSVSAVRWGVAGEEA